MKSNSELEVGESSWRYRGWRVLAASVVGMIFSPGPLFFGSLGLLSGALHAEHGWDRAQIMLALTCVTIAAIPAMPLVGSLLDRYGVRRVLLPSTLVLIGALAIMPLVMSSLTGLYVGFILAGLLTTGAQSVCYVHVLASWFDRYRGIAIGVAASGIGIGFAIVPLIVQAVVDRAGWQPVYWVLALLVTCISLPMLLWLLRERKASPETSVDEVPRTCATSSVTSVGIVFQRREFWLIAVGILLAAMAFTAMVPTLVAVVKDRGMTAQQAASAAALMGATAAVSRLVVGFLMDVMFAPRVAMLVFGVAAGGVGLLAFGASGPWVYVAAVLIGVGFGAETDLMGYLITRYVERDLVGRAYGLTLSFFLAGTGLGPYFAGLAFDATGSYDLLLAAYTVCGLLAASLYALLGPYGRAPIPVAPPQPSTT